MTKITASWFEQLIKKVRNSISEAIIIERLNPEDIGDFAEYAHLIKLGANPLQKKEYSWKDHLKCIKEKGIKSYFSFLKGETVIHIYATNEKEFENSSLAKLKTNSKNLDDVIEKYEEYKRIKIIKASVGSVLAVGGIALTATLITAFKKPKLYNMLKNTFDKFFRPTLAHRFMISSDFVNKFFYKFIIGASITSGILTAASLIYSGPKIYQSRELVSDIKYLNMKKEHDAQLSRSE